MAPDIEELEDELKENREELKEECENKLEELRQDMIDLVGDRDYEDLSDSEQERFSQLRERYHRYETLLDAQ